LKQQKGTQDNPLVKALVSSVRKQHFEELGGNNPYLKVFAHGHERTATQIPLFTTHCSPELQKHIMLAEEVKKNVSFAVSSQQNIINTTLDSMIDKELDTLEKLIREEGDID
jgi:hypothetical protein